MGIYRAQLDFFFLHLKNREYSLIEKFLFITKAGIRVRVKQRVINILVKTAVELFHLALLIMPQNTQIVSKSFVFHNFIPDFPCC
jgi:hypothetical protein